MKTGKNPLIRCLPAVFVGALCATHVLPSAARDLDRPVHAATAQERYASTVQALIGHGMEYLGIRYRKGGNSPDSGLDCSGLVQNVFRNALGIDLPRSASEMARLGDKIALSELQPGDLVFFNTMRRTFSHVGIYVGGGKFLHAPSSGGVVRVENMSGQYWVARFTGARRVLPATES